MRTVQGLLFDFGKVISEEPDPVVWEEMVAQSGMDPADFHQTYWDHRDAYDRGTLNGRTYWAAVLRRPHLLPEEYNSWRTLDLALWGRVQPEMRAWIGRLHSAAATDQDLRTGILSNMGDAMAEGLLGQSDWLSHFDHHVWSHEHGICKPEAAIYHLAAEGLQLPPQQILFLDDKPENVAGARAVGMQALVYTTFPDLRRQLQESKLDWLLLE